MPAVRLMLNADISDKRTCTAALRKLGFSKSRLQMCRGATTYTHPEVPRFQITVSDTQFIATGCGWGHLSMATEVWNLRVSASERVLELLRRARAYGIIGHTGPVTALGLAVVCATGALLDARALQVTA